MPAKPHSSITKITAIIILQAFLFTQISFAGPAAAGNLRPVEKHEARAGGEDEIAFALKRGAAAIGALVEGEDYENVGVNGIRFLKNVQIAQPTEARDIAIEPRGGVIVIAKGARILGKARIEGPGVICDSGQDDAGEDIGRVGGYISGSPDRPFVIGARARIFGEGVSIGESIIGPDVVVNQARVRGTVAASYLIRIDREKNMPTRIGPFSRLEGEKGAIVVVGSDIGADGTVTIRPNSELLCSEVKDKGTVKASTFIGAGENAPVEFPHLGYIGGLTATVIIADNADDYKKGLLALVAGVIIADKPLEEAYVSSSGLLRQLTILMPDGEIVLVKVKRINFGAGAITSDFDGLTGIKSRSLVGGGAFVGVNGVLKAPVILESESGIGNISQAALDEAAMPGTIVIGVSQRPKKAVLETYRTEEKGYRLGSYLEKAIAIQMQCFERLALLAEVYGQAARLAQNPYDLAVNLARLETIYGQFHEIDKRYGNILGRGLDASIENLKQDLATETEAGRQVRLMERIDDQSKVIDARETILSELASIRAVIDAEYAAVTARVSYALIADEVAKGITNPDYSWVNPLPPPAASAAAIGRWQEAEEYKPAVLLVGRPVKYGTDGMRGAYSHEKVISDELMTPAIAYRMGISAGLLALRNQKRHVPVAMDPRPSSLPLIKAAIRGIREMGATPVLVGPRGIATTPILQWAVDNDKNAGAGLVVSGSHLKADRNGIKLLNNLGKKIDRDWEQITERIVNSKDLDAAIQEVAEENGISLRHRRRATSSLPKPALKPYNDYISQTVKDMRILLELARVSTGEQMNIIFDLANGAANGPVQLILRELPEILPTYINDGPGIAINEACGAEFIDKRGALVKGLTPEQARGTLVAHYDGDADRVIFSTIDSRTGKLIRLDGDWIASLYAAVIDHALRQLGLRDELPIGGAQTAYSNLEARRYQTERGLVFDAGEAETGYVRTGDKYVRDNLDRRIDDGDIGIGIGFEPAGHGFLIFSDAAKHAIEQAPQDDEAAKLLTAMMDIQNKAGGDAIRHSLLVIASTDYFRKKIAQGRISEPADFNKRTIMYRSPVKVHRSAEVPTLGAVKTEGNVGTEITAPDRLAETVKALQQELGDNYRTVIRPSGTEVTKSGLGVVRVYVEGPNAKLAQRSARELVKIIEELPEVHQALVGHIKEKPRVALVINQHDDELNAWEEKLTAYGFIEVLKAHSEEEALQKGYFNAENLALVIHQPEIRLATTLQGVVVAPMGINAPINKFVALLESV